MAYQEFLCDSLKSPVRSVRLFALSEIIQEGTDPSLLTAVSELSRVESDPECRPVVAHALNVLRRRLGEIPASVGPEVTPENFLGIFTNGTDAERLAILGGLDAVSTRRLAVLAPEALEGGCSPLVEATLIKVFSRCWPKEKSSVLLNRLDSKPLGIQLVCLETLVKMAPESLITHLPKLLGSSDPRLRALAIRGLSAVDTEEAVRHLQDCLTNGDFHTRFAAIQDCIHLPFGLIQPVLLAFLSTETDRRLLTMAGWLFEINPDPKVPKHLYAIMGEAAPEKAPILRKIFEGACQVLEDSGVVPDMEGFRRSLEEWIAERTARQIVCPCVNRFYGQDPEAAMEAENELRANLGQSRVRETLQWILQWDLPPAVKHRVEKILQGSPSGGGLEPPPRDGAHPPDPADETKLVPLLASFRKQDRERAEPILSRILEGESTSPALKATAFRTALRVECLEFVEVAEKALSSDFPMLVNAALDYMAKARPAGVLLFLGKFLVKSPPQVKAAAIRILIRHDPGRALYHLRIMLREKDPARQTEALMTMVHFDFSLVRSDLVMFLTGNSITDQVETGLNLFRANPDREDLATLERLERAAPPKTRTLFRSARRDCGRILVDTGALTPQDLERKEKEFAPQADSPTPPPSREKPAYALEKVRPPPKTAGHEYSGETLAAVIEFLLSEQFPRKTALTMVLGLMVLFGWYVFRGSGDSTIAGGTLVQGCPITVVGTLIETGLPEGGFVIETTSKQKFHFVLRNPNSYKFEKNRRYTVGGEPFRRSRDGHTWYVVTWVEKVE